jgi:hypothetical protein
MRRVVLLLLVFVLALALVACGGDSDDSGDSGGNASGGGAAAAATSVPDDDEEDEEATEAAPPLAVVTDADPMPDPVGASGVRAVLTANFESEQRSSFLVDAFENGTVTTVADNTYSVTPADGSTQIMLPKSIPAINNGIIDANVSVTGSGAAGVSLRTRKDPQGTFSGYVCWVSEPAGAGCSLNSRDTYTLLFAAPDGSVELQESNHLRVAMIGGVLQFEVNGQVIGQIEDATYVSGPWGLYAESVGGGTATGTFSDVVIYRSTGSYELP